MNIEVIQPHQVRIMWEYAYPYLLRSQQRGPIDDTTLAFMRESCMHDNTWRLLLFHEDEQLQGAAVLRLLDGALYISALGGKFRPGWHVIFFDWLKGAAGFMGIERIRFGGRKGWRRLLKPLGFKPVGGPYMEARV